MKKSSLTLACTATLSLVATSYASSPVTWGPAQTISGDSDVSIIGTLDRAYTMGSGITTTVNGVTFTPFPTSGTDFTTTFDNQYNGFGASPNAPFANLSGNYKSLLTGGIWHDGAPNSETVTLNNLINGTTYLIETWVNDSRGATPLRAVQLDSSSTVLTFNTTPGTDGGVGQFAIGTFTADATLSQTISYNAGSVQANGLELRVIPEPSAFAALAGGAAMLMGLRRRRA